MRPFMLCVFMFNVPTARYIVQNLVNFCSPIIIKFKIVKENTQLQINVFFFFIPRLGCHPGVP